MHRKIWFVQIAVLLIACVALQFAITGCAGKEKEETVEKKPPAPEIPAAVMDAFQKSYPNAQVKSTEPEMIDSLTFYEVEFVDGEVKRSVLYAADGKVVMVEEEITVEELPDSVKQTAAMEFPTCEIKEIDRITRDDMVSYELEIMIGEEEYEVVISGDGKILSKVQEEEDADVDEEEKKGGKEDDD